MNFKNTTKFKTWWKLVRYQKQPSVFYRLESLYHTIRLKVWKALRVVEKYVLSMNNNKQKNQVLAIPFDIEQLLGTAPHKQI